MALATFVVIRIMPSEQYAVYTVALAGVSFAAGVIFHAFGRIYVVGHQWHDLTSDVRPFILSQSMFVGLVACAAYPFMQWEWLNYCSAVVLTLAVGVSNFAKTIHQRNMKFDRLSGIEVSRSLLFLVLLAVVVWLLGNGLQAWQAMLIQSLAFLIVALPLLIDLNWSLSVRQAAEGIRIAKRIVTGEYRNLFGYLLVVAAFLQVDVAMLALLTDSHSLASYGSGFRYYSLLGMALNAVHTVMLPVVNGASSKGDLEQIYRTHRHATWLFTPAIVAVALGSQWLIPLIDGGKYPDSIAVFQILAISSICSFALSPHVNLLMRFERFALLLTISCAALAVNVVMNLALIPALGTPGAAWGTFIAYSMLNGSIFIASRRIMKAIPDALPLHDTVSHSLHGRINAAGIGS